jgi:hypothetical protein
MEYAVRSTKFMHCPPPTAHYPLSTTHDPLPTIHYPLPTTHYPLRIAQFAICNLQFAICNKLFLRKVSPLILSAALLSPFFCTTTAAQTVQPPEFIGIRVGLDHCYKTGLWTQVVLKLRGGSDTLAGQVTIETADGDGIPTLVSTPPEQPVRVSLGQTTAVRLYVRFGRSAGSLTARFIAAGKLAVERTFEAAPKPDERHYAEGIDEQPIYLVLGETTLGLEEAVARSGLEKQSRPRIGRLTEPENLPDRWYGYEGIDLVLISTDRPEIFQNLSPQSAEVKALDRWIRQGGRLVLSVGQQALEVFSPSSPWRRFLPGKLAGEGKEAFKLVAQLPALESFCESTTPLPKSNGGNKMLSVPRLLDVQGVVEAHEADLPLVVRTPRGLGQVLFLAADLDQFPLSKWQDRPLLIAKLIDLPPAKSDEVLENRRLSYPGYRDLAGQLRSALDRFPGVHVISFAWVALLIFIYILLIGPGDFLFLRRVLKRMEWTWLTFPLIVLGVSLIAYFTADALKGRQLRVSQIDLIDVDVASGLVRGTTWLNLFSPRTDTYDLRLQPRLSGGAAPDGFPGYFAWLGLPGSGFGGMHSRGVGTPVWSKPYSFTSNLEVLQNVPLQIRTTKSFTGRWFAEAQKNLKTMEADLTFDGQVLEGTLHNPLDFPLENCLLAQGRRAIEIPRIGPGETIRVGVDSGPADLNSLLTGQHMIAGRNPLDQYKLEPTPYNPEGIDADRILQMMMFYDSAGGRRYTNLFHGYQTFLDCSLLLRADRAILVGRGAPQTDSPPPGAVLLHDRHPVSPPQVHHTVFYRFIFPVQKK